jgi:hypothetical protein
MKEHERKKSTKPLQSQNPGEVTVGGYYVCRDERQYQKTIDDSC